MIDQEDRWWSDDEVAQVEQADLDSSALLRQELIDRVPVAVESLDQVVETGGRDQEQAEPTARTVLGAALERVRNLRAEMSEAQTELEDAFQDAVQSRGLPYRFRGGETGQLTTDNVVVRRTDGSVEDGWRATLVGEDVKLEKDGADGSFKKVFAAEEWVNDEQDRIAELLRPQFDQMVASYPDVWSQTQNEEMYRTHSCFIWSETAGQMLIGAAHVFPRSMVARVIYKYPGSHQDSQDMVKNVPIMDFIRWQYPQA